jgi:hypothetical protein
MKYTRKGMNARVKGPVYFLLRIGMAYGSGIINLSIDFTTNQENQSGYIKPEQE